VPGRILFMERVVEVNRALPFNQLGPGVWKSVDTVDQSRASHTGQDSEQYGIDLTEQVSGARWFGIVEFYTRILHKDNEHGCQII